jgi:signal transduction histidine kinase
MTDWRQRLPDWMRSVRFRMTLLYSAVLFGIAAVLVAGLYIGLSYKLGREELSRQVAISRVFRDPEGTLHSMPQTLILSDIRAFEQAVNRRALENLKTFSFGALGALFVVSLGVGWVIAGRVLAPISQISDVARRIQATDLSRRIKLGGPDDELKNLADTFDAMLTRLDAAFEGQRRFVADASHELRNPLAIIQTNLDTALAGDDAGQAERRRSMAAIRRATKRMSRLVDDLLILARAETPRRARTACDVARLLGEVAEDFAAAAAKRSLRIEARPALGVTLEADADALKRAVANLVENAVRLAPESSTITLACGRSGTWVWVAVADEGPGIPPEHHSEVFERFWRADKARSRAGGGAGLGLAIVEQIVEAHDGLVRVFSQEGEGSTFVLWLPGGEGDRPARPPEGLPLSGETSSTPG